MPALKGEKNASAKLTEDDVRAIRRDPRNWREVASDYGISPVQVWRIKNWLRWAHVPPDPA